MAKTLTAKLSATDLTVIRGERCLFKDLSFALGAGETLLLEGQNGSGKTSLLRALAGMLTPESGDIAWNGQSIDAQRQEYRESLLWLGHKSGLKGDLTLSENLRFEGALRTQSGADFDAVCERLGIGLLRKLPLRLLSAGQQRRVALARLLLSDVPLWLLDEPFTNLDKDGRRLVAELASEHIGRGGLCVIAAHQDVQVDGDVKRVAL